MVTIKEVVNQGLLVKFTERNYQLLRTHSETSAHSLRYLLSINSGNRVVVIFVSSHKVLSAKWAGVDRKIVDIEHLHRPVFKTKDLH